MANETMIQFLRGSVEKLPASSIEGALYFTNDEGVYLGIANGKYHRYGDFLIVDNVQSLPTSGAHTNCMYYCKTENILARYDTEKGWIQINKQPTADEMKVLLGLGTAAYKNADEFDTAGAAQSVRNYIGDIPSTAQATNIVAYIQEKTAGIVTDAALEELTGRVADAENAIDAINNETTGVLAKAKEYVDTEDVFHTDILTVNSLGGIAAGANLNNMTTHEILNTLLFPYVAFVINSSSRSAAAATLENGATQTLSSCTINVTKKSKPITSITLYNGSNAIETKTGDAVANGGSITFNGFNAITVNKSNNPNLKFTVTDGTTSTDKNVGASTFVYPYYWGVCAANATINQDLIKGLTKSVSSKGNKTDVPFTTANQKIIFAYPKAHGVLKSVIDPNNFEIIDTFTRSEIVITGLDGTAQDYYVYVSGAGTVTDFKIDFKY